MIPFLSDRLNGKGSSNHFLSGNSVIMLHRLFLSAGLFVAATICVAITGCHDIDLIIDRSVYEPHRSPTLTGWGQNLAAAADPGERLTYRGIYTVGSSSRIGMLRRFDRRQGWTHVVLSEALPVDQGTLIAVSGRVVTVERAITGTGRIHRGRRLTPDEIEVLCGTGPARELARRTYARIRLKLQEHISLPGSKLLLAEEPRWRVDWLRGERSFVVVAHNFDLMYAAEAQFLFSLEDQRLQKVFFMEWFKGE